MEPQLPTPHQSPIIKICKILFLVLLVGNLVYLDWKVFNEKSHIPVLEIQPTKTPEPTDIPCLEDCTELSPAVSSNPTTVPAANQSQSSGVKAFFVPFGSGNGYSQDWTDVPGLQAYVDSANYGRIKQVVFEASVYVPTGNETVWVRLYNETDKHPVWNSEVFFNGGSTAQLLISQPVTLDTGNKLYKVQMKTQLQYTAVLNQTRLHITVF